MCAGLPYWLQSAEASEDGTEIVEQAAGTCFAALHGVESIEMHALFGVGEPCSSGDAASHELGNRRTHLRIEPEIEGPGWSVDDAVERNEFVHNDVAHERSWFPFRFSLFAFRFSHSRRTEPIRIDSARRRGFRIDIFAGP